MKDDSELELYAQGIMSTGYPLEHWAANVLRDEGWSVINNKYYIDSDEERPRELDILAYKAVSFPDFDLRTSLIVSCKKVESRVWAFLRRPLRAADPNTNLEPFHSWTNCEELRFYLERDEWASEFYARMKKAGLTSLFGMPAHEVFAYQEMNRCDVTKAKNPGMKPGLPNGDSAIRASVLSLLKAQAYELGARKNYKKPRLYQFNLVALTDGDFIALDFNEEGSVTPSRITEQLALARYVIKNQDIFSRVCFTTKERFRPLVQEFNAVHAVNRKLFPEKIEAFYSGILQAADRRQVLKEKFERQAGRAIRLALFRNGHVGIDTPECTVITRPDGVVEVAIAPQMKVEEIAYQLPEVKDAAARVLKAVYRYEGPFEIIEDIPF